MTLDIVIPHYKETWETGYAAFEMIRLQRLIDFNDIHVYVVQDGEDGKLPAELFDGYPYEITQLVIPHSGVSVARNIGMDAGHGDWIMFHDFDDSFASTHALFHFFKAMETESANLIVSEWIGEQQYVDSKVMWLRDADGDDYSFLHGKMFRRSWLYDNHVRFNSTLTIHEDAFFMCLARMLMTDDQVYKIPGVQYATYYNPGSVTRSVTNMLFKTYDHFFKKANALIHELCIRNMPYYAALIAGQSLSDTYINQFRYSWGGADLTHVNKSAGEFMKQNAELLSSLTDDEYLSCLNASREAARKSEPLCLEYITFKDWIKMIGSDAD